MTKEQATSSAAGNAVVAPCHVSIIATVKPWLRTTSRWLGCRIFNEVAYYSSVLTVPPESRLCASAPGISTLRDHGSAYSILHQFVDLAIVQECTAASGFYNVVRLISCSFV